MRTIEVKRGIEASLENGICFGFENELLSLIKELEHVEQYYRLRSMCNHNLSKKERLLEEVNYKKFVLEVEYKIAKIINDNISLLLTSNQEGLRILATCFMNIIEKHLGESSAINREVFLQCLKDKNHKTNLSKKRA